MSAEMMYSTPSSYCYEFYRKPFQDIDKQVWGGMIRDHNYTPIQWQEEIRAYMARGTFCPKPKEILGQLAENHERKSIRSMAEPVELTTDCPPDVEAGVEILDPHIPRPSLALC